MVSLIATAQLDSSISSVQGDTIQFVKRNGNFYYNKTRLLPRDLQPMLTQFSSSKLEFQRYKRFETTKNVLRLHWIDCRYN